VSHRSREGSRQPHRRLGRPANGEHRSGLTPDAGFAVERESKLVPA
jgi:hypothetical protein